jgi:hypothetical protein
MPVQSIDLGNTESVTFNNHADVEKVILNGETIWESFVEPTSVKLIGGESISYYDKRIPVGAEIVGTSRGGALIHHTPNILNSTNSIAIVSDASGFTDIKSELPSNVSGIKNYFHNGKKVIITALGSVFADLGGGYKRVHELSVGTGGLSDPYTEAGIWLAGNEEEESGFSTDGSTVRKTSFSGPDGGDWSMTLDSGIHFLDDEWLNRDASSFGIRTSHGIFIMNHGEYRMMPVSRQLYLTGPQIHGAFSYPQPEHWYATHSIDHTASYFKLAGNPTWSANYLTKAGDGDGWTSSRAWKGQLAVTNSSSTNITAFKYTDSKLIKQAEGLDFYVMPMKDESSVWAGFNTEASGPAGYKIIISQGGYSGDLGELNSSGKTIHKNFSRYFETETTEELYQANPQDYNPPFNTSTARAYSYDRLIDYSSRLIDPTTDATMYLVDDYAGYNSIAFKHGYMAPAHKALWDSLHDANGYLKEPNTVKLRKSQTARRIVGVSDAYRYEESYIFHWSRYVKGQSSKFVLDATTTPNIFYDPAAAYQWVWYDKFRLAKHMATDMCNGFTYTAVIEDKLFVWGCNKYGKLGIGDYAIRHPSVFDDSISATQEWDFSKFPEALQIGTTRSSTALNTTFLSNGEVERMHKYSPWGQWLPRPVYVKYDHHGNEIKNIADIACTDTATFILRTDGVLLASGSFWRPIAYVDGLSANEVAAGEELGFSPGDGYIPSFIQQGYHGDITQEVLSPYWADNSDEMNWQHHIDIKVSDPSTIGYNDTRDWSKANFSEFKGWWNEDKPEQEWNIHTSKQQPIPNHPIYPSRFEETGFSNVSSIAITGENLLLVKDNNGTVFHLTTEPREKFKVDGWDSTLTNEQNYTTVQQFESTQTVNSNNAGHHPTGL